MFQSLPELMSRPTPVRAPLALNALMAKMAERAGFEAVYLGGGGMGYENGFLEANLTLTEVAHRGVELASATTMPIIADVACGWGEPVHVRRTIAVLEAAGLAAMEIEDQVFPKRVHHHVGKDHLLSQEEMEAKIRSAVEGRRNPDFLVIARTNAAGKGDIDDALRRSEAYRRAGADVLMPTPGNVKDPDVIVSVAERLGPPLMFLAPPGGLGSLGLTLSDLYGCGYRIVTDAITLQLLVLDALQRGYKELAGSSDAFAVSGRTAEEWWKAYGELNDAVGLETLLAVERATVERE